MSISLKRFFFFFLGCVLIASTPSQTQISLKNDQYCESLNVTVTWQGAGNKISIYISGQENSGKSLWESGISSPQGQMQASLGYQADSQLLVAILYGGPPTYQVLAKISGSPSPPVCNLSNIESFYANEWCFKNFSSYVSSYSSTCARLYADHLCLTAYCQPCRTVSDLPNVACCSNFDACPELVSTEIVRCNNGSTCSKPKVPARSDVPLGCGRPSPEFQQWCGPPATLESLDMSSCSTPSFFIESWASAVDESEECWLLLVKMQCSQCTRCEEIQWRAGVCATDCDSARKTCRTTYSQNLIDNYCVLIPQAPDNSCPYEVNSTFVRRWMEVTSLKSLFQNCDGPNWKQPYASDWANNLPTSTDVCKLQGVTCDSNKFLQELSLPNVGLKCSVVWNTQPLKALQLLDLSYNDLGFLPDLASLPALVKLNLAKCDLKNEPVGLWNLPNLREIQLGENSLTSIDPSFFNSSVVLLNVSYNAIPSIKDCQKLPAGKEFIICPQTNPQHNLCDFFPTCGASSDSTTSTSNESFAAVGGAIGGGAAGVILVLIVVVIVLRRRGKKQKVVRIEPNELKMIERIGQGNFGFVSRGMWRESTEVAIKTLKEDRKLTDAEKEEFLAEAKLVGTLPPHPNIVQFLGVCFEDDQTSIVLEFMSHGSLLGYMAENALDDVAILNVSKLICAGMVHLEQHKIIHKDLACRNILIDVKQDTSGEAQVLPKISDFGLSHSKKKAALPVRWTAPEIFQNRESFSHASDVWSFGIVLIEIVTRDQPYPLMTNKQVYEWVSSGHIHPKPANCPHQLYHIISCTFDSNVRERPKFSALFVLLQSLELDLKKSKITFETETKTEISQPANARRRPLTIHGFRDPEENADAADRKKNQLDYEQPEVVQTQTQTNRNRKTESVYMNAMDLEEKESGSPSILYETDESRQ